MMPHGVEPQPNWLYHARRILHNHPHFEAWLRRKLVGIRGLWFEEEGKRP